MSKKIEKYRLPIPVIVALGFLVPIALGFLWAYLVRDIPTQEEFCEKTCEIKHQSGQLVHVYTWMQTAGMGGKGPMECQCR